MKRAALIIICLFAGIALVAIQPNTLPSSMKNLLQDNTLDANGLYEQLTTLNDYPAWEKPGELVSLSHPVNDTTNAPFHVFVPESYNPATPTPVLLYLHGGIGVTYFYEDYPQNLMDFKYLFNDYAKDYIVVCPQSKEDCEWWDESGYEMVHGILFYLKTQLNIDDDRVFVSGTSDGGSGSYHLAFTRPSEFSAFIPLIGMMSVGSFSNNQGAYVVNLSNRPIFASNTDQDGLYPTQEMRKYIKLALDAGANIIYKEFNGFKHDDSYIESHLDFTFDFMKRHPRDPFSPHITWETDKAMFGDCDWLSIARIDTTMDAQPWQITYQDSIQNTRLTIGFHIDPEFNDSGVRVLKLSGGETIASSIGLAPGDVIIEFDGEPVKTIPDIATMKNKTTFGNPIALKVIRDGEEVLLEGTIPDAGFFNAFYYPRKSARVDADFYGNIFDIRTSRISALKIRIHPEMVNMQDPVKVIVNGVEVFNDLVTYDRDYIRNQFRKNFDRKALWVNELYIPVR